MAVSPRKSLTSDPWWAPTLLQGAVASVAKLLAISAALGALSGCASSGATAFDRQALLNLETENDRLQAEVTRLREQKLREDREAGCVETSVAKEEAEGEENHPDLPVVKAAPDAEDESPGPVASIRPAEPIDDEDPSPEGTRPVLKVRGQHEAWVYHRPLTAEDKKAKTEAPTEKSKPSADKSTGK